VAGREPLVADGHGSANHALALLECLAAVRGTDTPDLPALERKLLPVALPGGPALLVSSRRDDSRTAEALTRRLERPVAYIDAADPPSFYQPPGAKG
jgi:hypothetical protein